VRAKWWDTISNSPDGIAGAVALSGNRAPSRWLMVDPSSSPGALERPGHGTEETPPMQTDSSQPVDDRAVVTTVDNALLSYERELAAAMRAVTEVPGGAPPAAV
jgi:hypothetical protein